MHPADGAEPPARRRLLDLRSGGWLLLLAGALCSAVIVWQLAGITRRAPAIGDGRHVESYGFDLSTCLVPRDLIVAAGFPKDGVPALTDPAVFTRAELGAFDQQRRRAHQGAYLVDSDRVIGVAVGGEARAYPLRALSWHEIVNDTLGGRPIAVTYSPLCDSSVVFERRVGDETLTFGISGLLYNSNLLMYDRRGAEGTGNREQRTDVTDGGNPKSKIQNPKSKVGESLWSQLQFRAIAGPAATKRQPLEMVPAVVVHWADWQAHYPETTVLAPDPSREKLYEERSYDLYFASEKLHFPVAPRPPKDGPAMKTPIVAVRVGSNWRVFTLSDIAARARATGAWSTSIDGVNIRFDCREEPLAVWPQRDDAADVGLVHAFWFAWHAMHPDEFLRRP